jgi:hypothetical protein
MKRLAVLFLLITFYAEAQTGIGTTAPHASAKLEVSASDKGFLPPRVTLTSATTAAPISSPAEGLLVYNLGSVGLQAGYYYWNGVSWATIATASLSGDNVQSTSLVKLYQEAYSTASNKAPSSGGFSFTVPVSGRYEFNFNCTAWNANGSKVLLTYNIRQGTTVLGSDYHESTSSNVWAEYEGRVEVNLSTGITYNAQVVTTTGSRDTRDWDKIFYKLVAGNLPVNQHIASTNIQLNNNFLSNDGGNEGIKIDNDGNVGIGTSSPTSKLDVTGNVKIGTATGDEGGEIQLATAQTNQSLSGSVIVDVYRNQLRILESGSNARGVNIDLSKAPASASGEMMWKKSDFVPAGTFISLDNLKVAVTTGGNRGLSIGAVATNFQADVSGWYTIGSNSGGRTSNDVNYTTTASGSVFDLNLITHGDMVQTNIRDKTNSRFYRVTMMIGASYVSNFLSIERLH